MKVEVIKCLSHSVELNFGEISVCITTADAENLIAQLRAVVPVPADVEEAAEITHDEGMKLSDDYNHYLATGLTEGWERPICPKWMMKFAKKRFLAGAEYQRRQDQSLIELAEDHAMLAGMNKMKERMMKDAMECNVIWYDGRLLDFTQKQLDAALDKIGAGVDTKVSVIIIKKEK